MSLREAKKRRVHRDILTAAGDLIGRFGYARARMRDIAEAAGVSYQTLYNYFPTKARVLQALLTAEFENTASMVDAIITGYAPGTLLDAMRAISRVQMGVVTAHNKELWKEVAIAFFADNEAVNALYGIIGVTSHAKLASIFTTARDAGDLADDIDIELLAQTVFALSDFAFMYHVIDPAGDRQATLERIDSELDLLIRPYLRGAAALSAGAAGS